MIIGHSWTDYQRNTEQHTKPQTYTVMSKPTANLETVWDLTNHQWQVFLFLFFFLNLNYFSWISVRNFFFLNFCDNQNLVLGVGTEHSVRVDYLEKTGWPYKYFLITCPDKIPMENIACNCVEMLSTETVHISSIFISH